MTSYWSSLVLGHPIGQPGLRIFYWSNLGKFLHLRLPHSHPNPNLGFVFNMDSTPFLLKSGILISCQVESYLFHLYISSSF